MPKHKSIPDQLRLAALPVALAGLLFSGSVVAQPVDAIPPAVVMEPGAVYAVPTRIDKVGRILAPVMVNGVGPFRFILDTGAKRSVLSPRAAARLNLVPAAETSIAPLLLVTIDSTV